MIARIYQSPSSWLNLSLCKILYESAPHSLTLYQPLPAFDQRYPLRLEGILDNARSSYDEVELYPTLIDVAAYYLVRLNIGHPFINGNKRISVFFTDMFLYVNGIDLKLYPEDMFTIAAKITEHHERGEKDTDLMIAVKNHIRPACLDAVILSKTSISEYAYGQNDSTTRIDAK